MTGDERARYERHRKYAQRAGRPYSVPALGSVRRLQALARLGWPAYMLSARLGLSSGEALLNLTGRTWVRRVTAQRITVLYDELSMTPGPSTTTRRRAVAKGWAPPLAWDDETIDDPTAQPVSGFDYRGARSSQADCSAVDPVAVERALGGDRVSLSKAERAEVVRRVVERGQGVARVCQLLPVSNATAQRLVNDARRETRVPSAKVAS